MIYLSLGGVALWSISLVPVLFFCALAFVFLPLSLVSVHLFFSSLFFFFPCLSFVLSLLFLLSSLCCQEVMFIEHHFLACQKWKQGRRKKKKKEEGADEQGKIKIKERRETRKDCWKGLCFLVSILCLLGFSSTKPLQNNAPKAPKTRFVLFMFFFFSVFFRFGWWGGMQFATPTKIPSQKNNECKKQSLNKEANQKHEVLGCCGPEGPHPNTPNKTQKHR